MYDLQGKSILITGAGSGMGREAALLAAHAGAKLGIADINEAAAKETLSMVEALGATGVAIRVDVSSEESVRAMVETANAAHGRLDGAFNNAGVPPSALPLHEISEEAFRRTMNINAIGIFFCLKHEIASMLKTGGGAIVNTSSSSAVTAFPNAADYITSKHAVNGLTRAAAIDYGTQGIRVNAIMPGATVTPMLIGAMASTPGLEAYMSAQHPIGRLGQPSEIAAAAIWLLSGHASFVTGACMAVDGGYTAV